MATDAELLAPVTPAEEPQAPPAEPPPEEAKVETPASEDADLDKLEEQAIEVPGDVDKLVPLSALTKARDKLKDARRERDEAKAGSAEAAALNQKVAALEQQVSALAPYADAYKAALTASQQPETPKGPTPEETAHLEAVAKTFDFYKTDGSFDLDRAKTVVSMIDAGAERKAQAAVAPIQQQSAASQSQAMLRSAKLTKLSDGSSPSPEVIDYVWNQLDPSVTSTKAGAQQAFAVAVGYAQMLGKMQKGTVTTEREPVPPPILTEKSGGKMTAGPSLTEADKRAAKDLGMTEKQYAEELATMPQGWGKR